MPQKHMKASTTKRQQQQVTLNGNRLCVYENVKKLLVATSKKKTATIGILLITVNNKSINNKYFF